MQTNFSRLQLVVLLLSLPCTILLAGCGMGPVDSTVAPVQASASASLHGSVYGGHAPIIGAEVFILTTGVTGYYSAATDITNTTSGLPTDPTFGYRYVTTGAGGLFDITGDYACTPNYPVFLAAYGGNPSTVPSGTLTAETIAGTGPYTITFTNQSGLVYQGETVTLAGFTGSWAFLNGDQTVLGNADLTTTTFDITVSSNGGNTNGSYTATGTVAQATTGANSNPAVVNLAMLGLCPSSGNTNFAGVIPYIYVNEVSTVAAGYAMAGFQSGQWFNIGIPDPATHPPALRGIQNATLTASNLYDITGANRGTGNDGPDNHIARSTTVGGNGVVPQSLLNSLANILANCVDSNNTSTTQSPQCSNVFGYARSAGTSGTTPTDIATAIFNIAHNPSANVTSLFNLPTGNVPFFPNLNTAPTNFTVSLIITGGGLSVPSSIAIDSFGNVWAANDVNSSLSKFSSTGTAISTSTGYTGGGLHGPYDIAIDASDNVWVANLGGNSLSKFSSTGTDLTGGSGYTGGGLNGPNGVAIDASGNVWASNLYGNSLSKFSSTGSDLTGGSGYTGGGLSFPSGIAIDASDNVWVANYGNRTISKFSNAGSDLTGGSGFTGGGLSTPRSVAIDASSDVWATTDVANRISKFSSTGSDLTGGSGYTGGGLSYPYGIAIDSSGNVWVTDSGNSRLSKFSSAGTDLTGGSGYNISSLSRSYGIAIDASGNVWVTSFGNSTLTELVGAAAPVVTPLAANLLSPYGTATVNLP